MRSEHGVGWRCATRSRWIQSCSACLVVASIVMLALGLLRCLVTNATMGDSRPFPLGMPSDAWMRRPWIRWRSRTRDFGWRMRDRSSCVRDVIFSVGSEIVRASPSNNHPRISFWEAHSPSPWASFFNAMGSSLGFLVIAAGGKMRWIA